MPSKPPADARWVVFALGATAFLLSFFHRVAPAAIAGELTQAFDVSGAALGALAAAYFYIYTVMQLPTGVLADTLGPRRVLTAGGVVAGIGSIVFGGADSVALAAAGRTLVGLGVSVAFICLLKLNANWFAERQFATAVGLSNIFGMSGALLATAPLAWLIIFASWAPCSLPSASFRWRWRPRPGAGFAIIRPTGRPTCPLPPSASAGIMDWPRCCATARAGPASG